MDSGATLSPMFRKSDFQKRPSQTLMEMTAPNGAVTLVEEVTPEMCKDEDEDIFFDTIGVQFHFGPFLWQLIAHLVLPLFPFMINRSGQLQNDVYTRFTSWVTPILIYLMLFSYSRIPDHMSAGVRGAFLIPVIYVLQHRLVIAIKYGSLSPTEYKRFMECKDSALCHIYLDQMQLFQGWFYFNPRVIRFELSAASARTGSRISDIEFTIADPHDSPSALNQCRAWNAFLRGHDVIDYNSAPCDQLRLQPDGTYSLTVYDFCEALALKSIRTKPETERWSGRVTDFFNVLNFGIPLVLMACFYDSDADDSGQKAWLAFFYISSTLLNFFYAKLFFILLNIAVVDVFRQWTIMSDLNTMIRMTDLSLYAELSSSHKLVTREQQRTVDLRMQEILSIRPSRKGKKPAMYTESLNEDTESSDANTLSGNSARENVDVHDVKSNGSPHVDRVWQARAPTTTAAKRASVLGERIYKNNEAHLLPRLSFDCTQNIVAWTHARLVMQNFGERFHFRLSLYVIAAMLMLVMFMLLGLVHMGTAEHPQHLFCTPWLMQLLLSVSMVIVFLALIMLTGSYVNETLERHSESLSAHELRVYRKISLLKKELAECISINTPVGSSGPTAAAAANAPASASGSDKQALALREEIVSLQEVLETLDDMRTVTETNAATKPFKIFGFTASSSLTMSILTTAFSFYAILASLLFKTDSEALSSSGAM